MKLLVILVSFITLCAASAIPLRPGDNSDYVEGVSRYIWMPDGEGVPHLIDLEEPAENIVVGATRNGANNAYWLYTRENPITPQILRTYDEESIYFSNYDSNKPIKVIVHGWNSNGNSGMNPQITSALLEVLDCNVIVVDWSQLANRGYLTACSGVPSVGEHLGLFLKWLINTAGGDWNKVHLIGFSLGAHVVGNAGRTVGDRTITRITGLDPAGPTWGNNDLALTASDGQYVEAIHTNGGMLGIFDPIGVTNFYPNGGRNPQPGCWISTCSHSRAYELFASSVYTDHFVAYECATLNDARNGRCTGNTLTMGNGDIAKRGEGLYYLTTGRSWPF